MTKRIVVTGIGAISSAGTGVDAFWDALVGASHEPQFPVRFDTQALDSRRAHEVREIERTALPVRKVAGERGMQFAVACAYLALNDAKLEFDALDPERVGVVYGSTLEAVRALTEFHRRVSKEGPRCADPGLFPNTGMSAAACQVSISLGYRAFNTTISNGATAGLDAIIYGYNMLLADRADFVIAGGVYPLCYESFLGYMLAGVLSPGDTGIARPFDAQRCGTVLGEGGAALLLETYESAMARGVKPLAEIKGGASVFDPTTKPGYGLQAGGATAAMQDALERSSLSVKEIDLVVANASGDRAADCMESRALLNVFGKSDVPAVTAPKATIGECLSASGAFHVAAAALALSRSTIPATMNFEAPGKGCRIEPIRQTVRNDSLRNAIVNSYGYLGINTSLVLAAA